MKKTLLPAVFTVLLFINLSAAESSAASYLFIDSYPLYSAMGPSTGVTSYGIQAAGINPAGAAGIEGFEFAAMHNMWFGGVSNQKISFAKTFGAGVFGTEISYIDFGPVPELIAGANLEPVATGEIIMPYAVTASLFYGKKIREFSVGAAVKFINEDLAGEPVYFGSVDAGFTHKNFIKDGINFGMSLLNISTEQDGFFLPVNLKAGLSHMVRYGGEDVILVAGACSYLPGENYIKGEAGFNYTLFEQFFLRGGISINNTSGFSFSGGAGFKVEGIKIDYAFLPDPVLGNTHKISVSGSVPQQAGREPGGEVVGGETLESYMKSGDYYYDNKQFRKAIKYYEYVNLIFWKEIESLSDSAKSSFYQKLGISYYNVKENRRAKQYFERALYFEKDNEVLKHWIRLIK